MIKRIVKHEWMVLSREKILYIALPIYIILIAYGVFNGTQWKNFLQSNTAEAVALADKGMESKLAKIDRLESGADPYSFNEDPRVAAALARFKGYEFAAKIPSSGAAIAIGQSDVLPSYLKVQWRPMFKQPNTDEIENPKNLAVGAFDLSFVLIYLYPLLIIALSYNILSSERENGTQALLLSQPVSVRQFVLGKIVLRGSIVIGIAMAISLGGLLMMNPDILSGGQGWRVLALATVLFLYGVFWFGLSVLVNAFGKKSATNALALMAVWIALVLIMPASLNIIAKGLHPLPSRIEMVQSMRRADRVAEKKDNFQKVDRSDLLRKGEEEAVVASTNDYFAKILPVEAKAENMAAPIFVKFQEQRQAQQGFTERLKFLTPAAVAQLALSDLADHGAQSYDDFNTQVERYHQKWRAYFLPAIVDNRLLTRDEVKNIPRFEYAPEAEGVVFGRFSLNAIVLALFAAIALTAGFIRLKKYPAAGR
ncbi:conserved membrane protein of unknown function [uncultured Sphingopyxis sp.]|uniref:ABC-2 type transport system permease protein n=1 Tax=uncultured Sphingopyxis sp. TaxID=310581 RepID=A0A1Y5PP84_9SPHN|nr:ABC transporter permease subunit [uncultured Sphingopyxis sp.]SBV31828.1 conserved membrane protein of unknown function [uncultured Sphingopyxis sp.]